MLLLFTFLTTLVLVLAVLLVLTVTKSKWGINLRPPVCPDCGHKVGSMVRIPANARQALWGGLTCEKCRCEMDKWGRKTI